VSGETREERGRVDPWLRKVVGWLATFPEGWLSPVSPEVVEGAIWSPAAVTAA